MACRRFIHRKDLAGLDHDPFAARRLRQAGGIGAFGTRNPIVCTPSASGPGAGRKKYWQELVEQLGSLKEHTVDHLEVRSVVAQSYE